MLGETTVFVHKIHVKCKAVSTDGGNFVCVFDLLRGSFHFIKKRKKRIQGLE